MPEFGAEIVVAAEAEALAEQAADQLALVAVAPPKRMP